MKKIFFALVVALALPAFAQTNTSVGTQSDSAAFNSGISLVNNSYAQPVTSSALDSTLHVNQAQSVPPSFSSNASVQTCASAGVGMAAQFVGGGISYAGGNGVDIGCDLKRDVDIMAYAGATKDDILARVCQKPEIKKSMAKCKALDKVAEADKDPYIASSGRAYPSVQ